MSVADYQDKKLDEMNDDEMHYLIEYTDKVANAHVSTANSMYAAANETEQGLSGQLMLLNTVILTASLLALGNNDLFKQITIAHKIFICSIFVLQVVSIIAGIVNYKKRERFFCTSGY